MIQAGECYVFMGPGDAHSKQLDIRIGNVLRVRKIYGTSTGLIWLDAYNEKTEVEYEREGVPQTNWVKLPKAGDYYRFQATVIRIGNAREYDAKTDSIEIDFQINPALSTFTNYRVKLSDLKYLSEAVAKNQLTQEEVEARKKTPYEQAKKQRPIAQLSPLEAYETMYWGKWIDPFAKVLESDQAREEEIIMYGGSMIGDTKIRGLQLRGISPASECIKKIESVSESVGQMTVEDYKKMLRLFKRKNNPARPLTASEENWNAHQKKRDQNELYGEPHSFIAEVMMGPNEEDLKDQANMRGRLGCYEPSGAWRDCDCPRCKNLRQRYREAIERSKGLEVARRKLEMPSFKEILDDDPPQSLSEMENQYLKELSRQPRYNRALIGIQGAEMREGPWEPLLSNPSGFTKTSKDIETIYDRRRRLL